MDLSQLKTQVMTMMMMKSAQNQGKPSEKGNNNEIFTLLYSMLVMNAIEYLFKVMPTVGAFLKVWIMSRWIKKMPNVPELLKATQSDKKDEIYSVTLMRTYASTSSGTNNGKNMLESAFVEKVDAVIDHLCALDSAKHVRIDSRCSLANSEEIEITPLLKAKVKNTMGSAEEGQAIEILLYSSKLKVSEIRNWIDDIHAQFVYEKNNKLGNKSFYFNEIPQEPPKMMDSFRTGDKEAESKRNFTYRFDNAPKSLLFSMNEFHTSKSFKNVYGDHVDELKERIRLFVEHPEWYMERGIPHSLGIMLHGVPGAGKTSTIKAVAKDTNRHIFNLSLRAYTTQRQLLNLFLNEVVSVIGADGQKQTLRIPLNKRVYVIEDIDCLTDVVLDRELKAAEAAKSANNPAPEESEQVTLSFLLNLLDGVLETPGRILIITSNYPERLDRALIRPGRIDVRIEFKRSTCTFIHDMLQKFYDITIPFSEIPTELEGVFTPAEVMESCCYFFKDYKKALAHMVSKRPVVSLPSTTESETSSVAENKDEDHESQESQMNGQGLTLEEVENLAKMDPKKADKLFTNIELTDEENSILLDEYRKTGKNIITMDELKKLAMDKAAVAPSSTNTIINEQGLTLDEVENIVKNDLNGKKYCQDLTNSELTDEKTVAVISDLRKAGINIVEMDTIKNQAMTEATKFPFKVTPLGGAIPINPPPTVPIAAETSLLCYDKLGEISMGAFEIPKEGPMSFNSDFGNYAAVF